jgi:hypothetical protein
MQRATKLRLMAASAVFAFALACGGGGDDDPGTGPSDEVTGTYVLTKINGSTPPGIYYQTAAYYLRLDTATVRLSANGAYSDIRGTTLFDVTGEHKSSDARTGTWTSNETTVTLSFTNDLGIPATAVLARSGLKLSITEGTAALEFTKK